jgi:arginine deiminase
VRCLAESGAEVLLFAELLESAVQEAKRRGMWATWLSAALPRLSAAADAVNAATLLGRDPRYQFLRDPAGVYRHVIDGVNSLVWARDFGVMTPSGLVIANSPSAARRYESVLFRFMTRFAPELREYPVVFDGAQEGLYLEGGDVAVLDEHTLLVGTGNCTDPRVAPMLARALKMDVIAVEHRKTKSVRAEPDKSDLQSLFPHLDTLATVLGPKHALVVPWLLEARWAENNPFIGLLEGVMNQDGVDGQKSEDAIAYLRDIGWIRRYAAESAREDESVKELKLADWLRGRGFEVLNVGGAVSTAPDYRHLVRVIFPELDHQGANVIATAPDQVIAFGGAPVTLDALRRKDIAVRAVDGRELRGGNGGPHCLALPLERG